MDSKENVIVSNHTERMSNPSDTSKINRIPKEGQDMILGEAGVWTASLSEAEAFSIHEHSLGVRQALKAYPFAVFWSLTISMSIIMEGYDTILIGSLYAYPSYAKKFGQLAPGAKNYQIPAKWQSTMGSGPQAGAFFGAMANGLLVPRYGYRPVFVAGMVMMIAFVFISFFGMTVELQAVGQILCGIPWGIFATIGPAYASELCPLPLRPYLTAYTNMCFATGQLIGAGVLKSFINQFDDWAWRIPFAIQWLWPPFLLLAAAFMPESPWHLVRHGKYAQAEKNVTRLMASPEKSHARGTVAMMIHTNNIEKEMSAGTSYLDCFRRTDLRRTEIACITFLGQISCGAQFAYSATYFFQQAGLNSDDSYKLNLGGTAIAFLGTIGSWFLLRRFGRRTLYMSGMGGMCVWLFIIGCLDFAKVQNAKWGQAALCIIWLLTFSLTVGPVGWAIPPEVSSTRVRSKTVVLARNTYYLAQIFANVVEPYMVNPTAWNWSGKTGFFWAGTALLTLIWAYFRLPETRGRSYEELDVMFAAKLPTKKFKSYQVNAYDEKEDVADRVRKL